MMVAGGAVLSANAQYLLGENERIPCANPPNPSCADILEQSPETIVYDNPATETQTPIGTLADYTFIGE